VIFIGRRAQRIVRKFLKKDPDAFLFSPADAEAERNLRRRAGRRVNLKYAARQNSRRACDDPERPSGDRYTAASYRRAIARACRVAGIKPFSPNRARHWAATRIRKAAGLESARTVLGHSDAETSAIYAERDMEEAREVMAMIG
jgi:integrase